MPVRVYKPDKVVAFGSSSVEDLHECSKRAGGYGLTTQLLSQRNRVPIGKRGKVVRLCARWRVGARVAQKFRAVNLIRVFSFVLHASRSRLGCASVSVLVFDSPAGPRVPLKNLAGSCREIFSRTFD